MNVYTSTELYEFRKLLLDWKWKGPNAVLKVIHLLCNSTLDKEALLASKLYKTVYKLPSIIQAEAKKEVGLYNKEQIATLMLRLKNLNSQIREIVAKPLKKKVIPKVEEKQFEFSAAKYAIKKDLTYQEHYGDYLKSDYRANIKSKLQSFLIKLKNDLGLYFDDGYQYEIKAETIAGQIETTLYFKHYGQKGAEHLYISDLKTLQQYFQKDKSGYILKKILDGFFSIQDVCQLHLKDWLHDDQIRQMENRQQESLEDANYYRELRIKEMTQSKGRECPRCHLLYVYLIDEKQIRRADEPATLFFECFACQHKYKV